MGELFRLSIVTPYGEMFNGEVKSALLPGKTGEFGILPSHCDMFSVLQPGVMEVWHADSSLDVIVVKWGYAHILNGSVKVVVYGAVSIERDSSSIAASIDKAMELLKGCVSDVSVLTCSLSKLQSY